MATTRFTSTARAVRLEISPSHSSATDESSAAARARRATEAETSQWRHATEAETSQWFNGEATWSVVADDMMSTAQRVAWALLAPTIALIITLLTIGQHTALTLSHVCLEVISFLYATY